MEVSARVAFRCLLVRMPEDRGGTELHPALAMLLRSRPERLLGWCGVSGGAALASCCFWLLTHVSRSGWWVQPLGFRLVRSPPAVSVLRLAGELRAQRADARWQSKKGKTNLLSGVSTDAGASKLLTARSAAELPTPASPPAPAVPPKHPASAVNHRGPIRCSTAALHSPGPLPPCS